MKFEKINEIVRDMVNGRYQFDNNMDFQYELLSLADEIIKNKQILRIKRANTLAGSWKTLVFIEFEGENEDELKIELKYTMNWIALLKQSLLGTENADLYLFLAFANYVNLEECLRIESTEQFCRKYVLLPNEDILDYLNRTFLQKLTESHGVIDGQEPIERAFKNTSKDFVWVTEEIQQKWREDFLKYNSSDLAEKLINEVSNYDTD